MRWKFVGTVLLVVLAAVEVGMPHPVAAFIPAVSCGDLETRSVEYGSGYVSFTWKSCLDALFPTSFPPVTKGQRGLCFESPSLTHAGANDLDCIGYYTPSDLQYTTRLFCEVTDTEYGFENDLNVGFSYIACARASDVYAALRPPLPILVPTATASLVQPNCFTIGAFVNCSDGTSCSVIGSFMFCSTPRGSIDCSIIGSFMFCSGQGLGNRSITCSLLGNRWFCS